MMGLVTQASSTRVLARQRWSRGRFAGGEGCIQWSTPRWQWRATRSTYYDGVVKVSYKRKERGQEILEKAIVGSWEQERGRGLRRWLNDEGPRRNDEAVADSSWDAAVHYS